jgi:phospholipase C
VNPTDECTKWKGFKAFEHWTEHVWTQDNIFKRMSKHRVTHRVYTQELVSLTSLVNGLFEDEEAVFDYGLEKFKCDLNENNLRQYSFLEPKFLGKHNDMHPSSALPNLDDGPEEVGTVLLGEALIWQVYNDIFTSPYKDKTLFIITSDEHGGCFDHVAPPPVKGGKGWPPDPNHKVPNEEEFKFDRLGIRVPMVMVSAYIQPNTIMNDHFDHTSFIKTMSKKHGLGHLTDRDLHAKSFEKVFSGPKRSPLVPIKKPNPNHEEDAKYHAHPINDLQASIIKGAHFLAKYVQEKLGNDVEIPSHEHSKTNGDALAYLEKIHHLTKFPKKN